MSEIKELFKKYNLHGNTYSETVSDLMRPRSLNSINSEPYYQRQYVWNSEKQSYFIDSILLGVSIPPLIFFKNLDDKKEIIDGKQRFETLNQFYNNKIKLSKKNFSNLNNETKEKKFQELSEELKDKYENHIISIVEFSIQGKPTEQEVEKIKIEIFKRYNTGIKAISKNDIFNANNTENKTLDYFCKELSSNQILLNKFDLLFDIKNKNPREYKVSLRTKIMYLLAISNIETNKLNAHKESSLDQYFEMVFKNVIEVKNDFNLFEQYKNFENTINFIYQSFFRNLENFEKNKLVFEALYRTVSRYDINLMISEDFIKEFKIFLSENQKYFSNLSSYHHRNLLIGKFKVIEIFFKNYLKIDITKINNNDKDEDDEDKIISIDKNFEIKHSTQPSNTVDALVTKNQKKRLHLRPIYQRGESTNQQNASGIIESILLGIDLPLIFIFVNKDNILEVLDGQQRLISIFSFLGQKIYVNNYFELNKQLLKKENYSNTKQEPKNNFSFDEPKEEAIDNDFEKTKLYGFKLKGLKVLKELNGKTFEKLSENEKNKIWDFKIQTILLDIDANPNFTPEEMFVRLNYKPYTIKQNSFELWNSYIDKNIIDKIKKDFKKDESWFYILTNGAEKYKRMPNEEMISTLIFLEHGDYDSLFSNFSISMGKESQKISSITIKSSKKEQITNFLEKIEEKDFTKKFNAFRRFKQKLKIILLNKNKIPESNLNSRFKEILGQNKAQRRTLTQIYVIWLVLRKTSLSMVEENTILIFKEIKNIFEKMQKEKSFKNKDDFEEQIRKIWKNFSVEERQIVLSENKKEELLKKQNNICPLCKEIIFIGENTEVDHIIPLSRGGKEDYENLQITHTSCNRKKYNSIFYDEN
jgi:hypothetical protein